MSNISPEIFDISSTDWDKENGEMTNNDSLPFHVEIGDRKLGGVDLFQMVVTTRPQSFHSKSGRFVNSTNMDENEWISPAVLFMKKVSIGGIRQLVQHKIDQNGPYFSWSEFARKLAPYLIWEYDGRHYPPDE